MNTFKFLLFAIFVNIALLTYATGSFAQDNNSQVKNSQLNSLQMNDVDILLALKDTLTITQLPPITSQMQSANIPAISIAFMENHQLVWTLTEGLSDFESQQNIDNTTLFQTTHISKPMYATALLNYQHELGFNLDIDVESLLKNWQLAQQSSQPPSSQATTYKIHRKNSQTPQEPAMGLKSFASNISRVAGAPAIDPLSSTRASISKPLVQYKTIEESPQLSKTISKTLSKTLSIEPLSLGRIANSQALTIPATNNTAIPHRTGGLAIESDANFDASLATQGSWTTPSALLKRASNIQRSYQNIDKSFLAKSIAQQILALQKEAMQAGLLINTKNGAITSFHDNSSPNGFQTALYLHPKTGDGLAIMTNSDTGTETIQHILARVSDIYEWQDFTQFDENVPVAKSDLKQLIINGDEIIVPVQSIEVLMGEGEQY